MNKYNNSNNQQSERHGRQINGSTTTGIPMQNSLTTETVRVTTRAQLQQQQQQDDGEEDNNEDDLSNNNNQQRPPPMGGGGSGQPGGNQMYQSQRVAKSLLSYTQSLLIRNAAKSH